MKKTDNIPVVPSPFLEATSVYRPPQAPVPVDLFLDSNEGSVPSMDLVEELLGKGSALLRRYPRATALEEQLARLHGLEPEQVLVTAGGDDAIERALRAVLAPGREMILPVPTFEMFERYAALTGAATVEIPWEEESFPIEAVIEAVSEATSLIVVVSPNSPTGAIISPEALAALSASAPHALLLVDLAYTEFADLDLTPLALELPNAMIVRSFSKAWGLAGLRVGWAAGPPWLVEWLRAAGHPYAVSSLSLSIASTRLARDQDAVKAFVEEIRHEGDELSRLLSSLGAETRPAQANFLLARFADAPRVRMGLLSLGISVRLFPDHPKLSGMLRLSLPGNKADFARLCQALKVVLSPEALLFDLDGVLADVRRSYREAIIATAQDFGVTVTGAKIAEAKAAGQANNDWELTRRLIQARGQSASLQEVTARFEEHYQGTDEVPGLRHNETLLLERNQLEQWARTLKLGVVTGRPRRDAWRFLQEQKIDDLFEAVVCMEDGPAKPNPAPVQKALDLLGVQRAWMIGDTPDDIRAARATGVLPLAMIGATEHPEEVIPSLHRAGTALILSQLSELEELL